MRLRIEIGRYYLEPEHSSDYRLLESLPDRARVELKKAVMARVFSPEATESPDGERTHQEAGSAP